MPQLKKFVKCLIGHTKRPGKLCFRGLLRFFLEKWPLCNIDNSSRSATVAKFEPCSFKMQPVVYVLIENTTAQTGSATQLLYSFSILETESATPKTIANWYWLQYLLTSWNYSTWTGQPPKLPFCFGEQIKCTLLRRSTELLIYSHMQIVKEF